MTRPDYVPDDAEDITDHGAQPNPDDSSASVAEANRDAIHAAANASAGTNVYVPEGEFYFGRDGSRAVRFGQEADEGGSIYGAGPEQSLLGASSAASTSDLNTLIEYESGLDHGDCEIRGLELDGNADELDTPGDAIDCKGNQDLSLTLERVYIHDIFMRGVRARDIDLTVRWCTFENIAIARNEERDGRSISHAITWSPSSGNELHVERSRFINIAGNPINDSPPSTRVTVEWCYAEGIGTGWVKLSSADISFRHCFAIGTTDELASLMTSDHDGRKAFYSHDGNPVGAEIEHFEMRNTTEFGIGVRRGYELEISGDKAVFHNIGFDRTNRSCFWERNGSGDTDVLAWDDFGHLSVHGVSNGNQPVFDTANGGGSIDRLSWSDADGVGSTGSTTIDTIDDDAEPIEVDVPSIDETGHNGTINDEEEGDAEKEEGEDEQIEDDAATLPDDFLAEWSPRWQSTETDWNVIEDSTFTGGHALAFNPDNNDRSRYALSWDAVGEQDDIETLDKFRVPEFTDDDRLGFHARVYIRASGQAGEENGYWVEIENRNEAFRVAKYSNGRIERLGRFGTPEPDTFYYRRFRAIGDELAVKIWPAADPEPDEWDLTVTDADHSSGWVGLGSYDTGRVETDFFSVATAGEEAPGIEQPELSLVTKEVSDRTEESAVLVGYVDGLSSGEVIEVAFEWGKADSGLSYTTEPIELAESGEVRQQIDDLTPGTEYECRLITLCAEEIEPAERIAFRTLHPQPPNRGPHFQNIARSD